jgi:hypothetical protein
MRCEGCGLEVEGGTDGCQAIFEAVGLRQLSDYRYARWHRLIVDAYAMQHPDRYGRSARSFAAHLSGLCAAFEYPEHPTLLRSLQQWLSGPRQLERPEPPSFRGSLTIADLDAQPDPESFNKVAQEWARDTWEAYRPLQPIARAWVISILGPD